MSASLLSIKPQVSDLRVRYSELVAERERLAYDHACSEGDFGLAYDILNSERGEAEGALFDAYCAGVLAEHDRRVEQAALEANESNEIPF